MKLENIEYLIDGNGGVTLGRCGPVRCAAMASDDDQCLAMLARRPGESLMELLQRLDSAIEDAYENDTFADEINT
ncbi:MAG: hypothetical protein R8K50_01720 [Mariprofundus sp.]